MADRQILKHGTHICPKPPTQGQTLTLRFGHFRFGGSLIKFGCRYDSGIICEEGLSSFSLLHYLNASGMLNPKMQGCNFSDIIMAAILTFKMAAF